MPSQTRPLTENERKLFDDLTRNDDGYTWAALRCEFEGRPAAVIANVYEDGDNYNVQPVALLLVSPEQQGLLDRITNDGVGLSK